MACRHSFPRTPVAGRGRLCAQVRISSCFAREIATRISARLSPTRPPRKSFLRLRRPPPSRTQVLALVEDPTWQPLTRRVGCLPSDSARTPTRSGHRHVRAHRMSARSVTGGSAHQGTGNSYSSSSNIGGYRYCAAASQTAPRNEPTNQRGRPRDHPPTATGDSTIVPSEGRHFGLGRLRCRYGPT